MLKICLTISCVFILLVGVTVSSFGAFAKVYFYHKHFFLLSNASYLIILFGIIISILAVFGLEGIAHNRKYILVTLTTAVFICFTISSLTCATLFHLRNYKVSSITKELLNYQMGSTGDESFDVLQQVVECCGVHNAMEFMMNRKDVQSHLLPSCLHQIDSNSTLIDNFVNFKGCNAFDITRYLNVATLFTFCIASTQLLLFFAFALHTRNLVIQDGKPPKKKYRSIRRRESSYDKEDLIAKECFEI